MVGEIGNTLGASELLEQTQSSQRSLLDIDLQQNILERQQRIEEMQISTQIEASPQRRTEPRIDSGDIVEFGSGLRDAFSQLQDAASFFLNESLLAQPVWDERNVNVSNSDVVTGEAEAGAMTQDLELEIMELAQAQEVELGRLSVGDEDAIDEGEYQFEIVQGDIVDEIDVNVEQGDTPEDILETVAEEIEATDAEVEAEVFVDDEEVFLEVRANEAGEAGEFELRDVEEGDFIEEQIGITNGQEAADAMVEIDEDLEEGEDFVLSGNVIELQDGLVELELEDTGTAEIEVVPDVEAITEAMEDLVGSIAEVESFITEQPASSTLEDMGSRLGDALENRQDELAQIGIEIDPEGEVIVDEETFQASLIEEPDTIEEIFDETGVRSGLAIEADMVAERALTQPLTQFMEAEEMAASDEPEIPFPSDNFEIYDQTGQISSMMAMNQGASLNMLF